MPRTGSIHYAKLRNSERLQKVLKLLSDGRAYTTKEIIEAADVCAVNSIAAELRENGIPVTCRPVKGCKGVFEYWLGA